MGVKLSVTWLHMALKKQKRTPHRRGNQVFIGAWIPESWASSLEALTVSEDSDRSKIVRKAILRRLQEAGR